VFFQLLKVKPQNSPLTFPAVMSLTQLLKRFSILINEELAEGRVTDEHDKTVKKRMKFCGCHMGALLSNFNIATTERDITVRNGYGTNSLSLTDIHIGLQPSFPTI
jgi:hypothetical protein